MTWPAKVKFWAARTVRYSWLWRDVSPGPLLAGWLWLWGRFPGWLPVPHLGFPRLPLSVLLAVACAVSFVAFRFDSAAATSANKDREGHRIKRTFQNAALDCGLHPIPELLYPEVKPHVVLLHIEPVAGSSARKLIREVTDKMHSTYRAPVRYHHGDDGTAIIAVHRFDPLRADVVLPAYLGNDEGPDIHPTWKRFPLGIDADGELLTITLFEQHLLLPGAQRTGKSTALAAIGIGLLAAPNCEPWAMDPQVVSLRCLKNHVPFASTPEQALDLLRDFHRSMEKREAEMDEKGTSLATPSRRWALKVLLIDELLRYIDPDLRPELDGKYADTFLGLLKDVLSAGPKTGHVIIATTTDPRVTVLKDGIRDLFTARLIFRTADGNASRVAGAAVAGYMAHELSKLPGRAILKDGGYTHCRTFGIWDQPALEAAGEIARHSLDEPPEDHQEVVQRTTSPGPTVIEGDQSPASADSADSRPSRPAYGEARALILWSFHNFSTVQTRAEIEQRTGLPRGTVRYWLSDEKCPNRIPTIRQPGNRYELMGGAR